MWSTLRYLYFVVEEAHQYRSYFSTGCVALWNQNVVGIAGDNAVADRPVHRRLCVVTDRGRINIISYVATDSGFAYVTVQYGD